MRSKATFVAHNKHPNDARDSRERAFSIYEVEEFSGFRYIQLSSVEAISTFVYGTGETPSTILYNRDRLPDLYHKYWDWKDKYKNMLDMEADFLAYLGYEINHPEYTEETGE